MRNQGLKIDPKIYLFEPQRGPLTQYAHPKIQLELKPSLKLIKKSLAQSLYLLQYFISGLSGYCKAPLNIYIALFSKKSEAAVCKNFISFESLLYLKCWIK